MIRIRKITQKNNENQEVLPERRKISVRKSCQLSCYVAENSHTKHVLSLIICIILSKLPEMIGVHSIKDGCSELQKYLLRFSF